MIYLACFVIGLILGGGIVKWRTGHNKKRYNKALNAAFVKIADMGDEEFSKAIETHMVGGAAEFIDDLMEFNKDDGISYD